MIFRPSGITAYYSGDEYLVQVTENQAVTLEYTVNFFDLEKIPEDTAISLSPTSGTDTPFTPSTPDTPATPSAPATGAVISDAATGALYKITASGAVEYQGSASKTASSITIPQAVTLNGTTYQVTAIAAKAFVNYKSLTSVVIGSNVTSIGANAFSGCTRLKSITIGKNVSSIGDKAFYKCTALTKITIPAKVSRIGKQAFFGCKKLKNITIKTKKLTTKTVGSKAFKGIHAKAAIKVPKAKLAAYKKLLRAKGAGKNVKIKK